MKDRKPDFLTVENCNREVDRLREQVAGWKASTENRLQIQGQREKTIAQLRKQVIAAAKEAGSDFKCETLIVNGKDADDFITSFYAIAYEAGRVSEREECAKVCESLPSLWPTEKVIADECAEAIRARSTK